jgi:Cdc6-like AAA superfamily ATPase
LFDWPCHANSRLLVVSIANTMDLPERMQVKISSRIGNNRLVYEPYTQPQILTILRSRLDDIKDVFDQRSLDFVSRKVSMYSGDIRRSLQIAKRAVEICRENHEKKQLPKGAPETKVTYNDVIAAFDELFNSKTVQVLQSLQQVERIAILSLFDQLKRRKSDKVLIEDLQQGTYQLLQQVRWGARFQTHTFREIVKRLQAFGLLQMHIEHHKITENVALSLAIYPDDIVNGLSAHPVKDKEARLLEELNKVMVSSPALHELFHETLQAKNLEMDD